MSVPSWIEIDGNRYDEAVAWCREFIGEWATTKNGIATINWEQRTMHSCRFCIYDEEHEVMFRLKFQRCK